MWLIRCRKWQYSSSLVIVCQSNLVQIRTKMTDLAKYNIIRLLEIKLVYVRIYVYATTIPLHTHGIHAWVWNRKDSIIGSIHVCYTIYRILYYIPLSRGHCGVTYFFDRRQFESDTDTRLLPCDWFWSMLYGHIYIYDICSVSCTWDMRKSIAKRLIELTANNRLTDRFWADTIYLFLFYKFTIRFLILSMLRLQP